MKNKVLNFLKATSVIAISCIHLPSQKFSIPLGAGIFFTLAERLSEFDVSISWSITGSELSYIIANANTYTSDYDLNDNNCTDYVISVALLTGVVLPDPQSSWPGGAGSNPGAFGQAIRNMTLLPGMSRNGDGGTSSFNSVNCN